MTGPEHYETAQRLLEQAYAEECDSAYHRHLISAATVHATLALTAATALNPGGYPAGDNFVGAAINDGHMWMAVAGASA